ncbi:hypothetical protein JMJ35_005029 [Cladonia borealis]|uniref:NADH-ubiquinone oxidoreductase B12 subunit n=1 Tax=Cladonia borealis TaxID=184061 RepID=A0AA39V289_9LECA|nr:hypothetical protein JMJ35_005029 [Cladonia borealis]
MAPPPRANLTGFDVRKLVQASRMPANDPWARSEQWRYTGPFTRWNRFRGTLPGFGIASVAFAAYCGYEYLFLNDSHHGHGSEHQEGEHH